MEIDLNLTPTEWLKFQKYIQRKKQKELKGFMGGFWSNMILWFGLTLFFVIIYRHIGRLHYPTVFFVFCIFVILIGLFCWNIIRLQRALAPSEQGTFVGKHRFVFAEDGIHLQGKGYKSFYDWDSVKSVERENGMIMLFIDTAHAFIFPEDQIDDPADFMSKVRCFKV